MTWWRFNKNPELYSHVSIPGTCLSSIFGFEPSKRRPFPFKTRVIWVPGMYICLPQWQVIKLRYSSVGTKQELEGFSSLIPESTDFTFKTLGNTSRNSSSFRCKIAGRCDQRVKNLKSRSDSKELVKFQAISVEYTVM